MKKPRHRRRNRRKKQQQKTTPPINSAPFPDPSGNVTLNPLFTTLHVWGAKNKRKILKAPTPPRPHRQAPMFSGPKGGKSPCHSHPEHLRSIPDQ